MPKRVGPVIERLWLGTAVAASGCWEWTNARSRDGGYGCLSIKHKPYATHRLSWELAYGPIPEGMLVLHKCDNPPCWRPTHLFLGTQKDNIADSIRKQRRPLGPRRDTSNFARGERWQKAHVGTQSRGERVHGARLTEADVREVRRLAANGAPLRELSERYGVRMSTLSMVIRRETWKHIE